MSAKNFEMFLQQHSPSETCVDCGLPGDILGDHHSGICVDCGLVAAKCPHWRCVGTRCPKMRLPTPKSPQAGPSQPAVTSPKRPCMPPLPPANWLRSLGRAPQPTLTSAPRQPSSPIINNGVATARPYHQLAALRTPSLSPALTVPLVPQPPSQAPHSPQPPSQSPHSQPPSQTPNSPQPQSQTPHSLQPPSQTPHSPQPPSQTFHSPLPPSQTTHSPQPPSQTPHSPQPLSQTPHSPLPPSQTPHSPQPQSQTPHLQQSPSQTPQSPQPPSLPAQSPQILSQPPHLPQTPSQPPRSPQPPNQPPHSPSHASRPATQIPPQHQIVAPPTSHQLQQGLQLVHQQMQQLHMSLPTYALHVFLPELDRFVPTIERQQTELPANGNIVLGRGAFGMVRLEYITGQPQPVAVKYVGVNGRTAIEREARALSLLSGHPSFPRLRGLVKDGAERSLVMDFIGNHVTGETITLYHALDGPRRLTIDRRAWLTLASDIVEGLRHMHVQGLLHNDIKCDNILVHFVGGTWRACVIDVGLCTLALYPRVYRVSEAEKARFRLYHPHIAPELVEKGAPQTQLSDIFQLGRVLYFIGQSGGIGELAHLGQWCLKKDPKRRPSTALIRFMLNGIPR